MSDRSNNIEHPASFLEENGILFEMNRQVLHPLGFELRFQLGDDGGLRGIELVDNRASAQPIFFSTEAFDQGRQKYETYMQEHGRRNIQKRRQIGMVIQTGPNLPHHIHESPTEGTE